MYCVKGSTNDIIIEVGFTHIVVKQSFNGNVCKKSWKKIKTSFNIPEAIDYHSFEGITMCEFVLSIFRDESVRSH